MKRLLSIIIFLSLCLNALAQKERIMNKPFIDNRKLHWGFFFGLNIMDTATYLFLAAKGYVFGRIAPILTNGIIDAEYYINPIPAGMVLTGIVVSVSVSALMLSLTIRLFKRYHSLDLDVISAEIRKEER